MTNTVVKVDTEFLDRWANELIEGDWSQTNGGLCTIKFGRPHYCCLGVAGCLLGAEWRNPNHFQQDVFGIRIQGEGHTETGYLPRSLGEKIGLLDGRDLPIPSNAVERFKELYPHVETRLYNGVEVVNLASLNDFSHMNFTGIGSIIRFISAEWKNVNGTD